MLSIALLLIYVFIQYKFIIHKEPIEFLIFKNYTIDILANYIVISFSSICIALLLALIPYKKLLFKAKIKTTIPIAISIVLTILILNYLYLIYLFKHNSFDLKPIPKYSEIQIPQNIDCSLVHNGKFETDKYIIERKDNEQIETDIKTKKAITYSVEWLSDCEYTLTSTNNTSNNRRIKIVAITDSTYECYVASQIDRNNLANNIIVKRIK
jgi:hypothetical protein